MTETKCHCQAKLNFSVDQLRQLSLVEVKKNGTWKVNSIVTQKPQALCHTTGVRWLLLQMKNLVSTQLRYQYAL